MSIFVRSLMLALALAVLLHPIEAFAGKRVALVVGNSAYRHAGELANPRNDASDIAAVLRKHGFEVIEGLDLDKAALDRTIRDFATALSGAETGLFFYAGHGLQVGGVNYIVPVDAQLATAAALDFEAVRLDLVHRTMEREAQTNLIFLDACRNNPLERGLRQALGTRSAEIGRGLAAVESGVGTLISFSTQPGNVAADGTGRNSPFAGALVRHLADPAEDLGAILIAVRRDVMQQTQRRQVPWEHSALTGKFYFGASPAKPASAETTTSSTADNQASMTRSVAAVEVGDFATHPAADEELTWLKIKIERNFVDFFVERGLKTTHRSSTLASSSGSAMRIVGALERNSPTSVDLKVQLHGPDGAVVVSKSIEASLPALKEHYKSIPEALIHALGVSPHTLRKSETSRVLTSSFPAMLLYLEAGRRAQLRQLDRASTLLDEAIKEDPPGRSASLTTEGMTLITPDRSGSSAVKQRIVTYRQGVDIDFVETASDLRGIEDAVQVGPLVVDPGGKNGIRRNDFDRQNRSVVCRQVGGSVAIIVITGGLSLYETGDLLAASEADGGFGCDRALNLDGGPSTQASFAWEAEVLEIPGRWKVPNALLLVVR